MGTIIHGLCLLLGGRGNAELLRQIDYLKIENQILRRKLPARIAVTPAERRRLIRFGRPLGKALHDLMSIVSPRTFARWLKAAPAAIAPKRGRPPVSPDIRKLVIRLAEENAWGYTRIVGELRKLGVKRISRSSVVNILRREGFDPGPKRGRGTWHDFIRRHQDTLWACDFLTKRICTMTGVVDCMVLFFIHLGSRRVHLAGLTTHPDRAWMADKARAVRAFFAQQPHSPRYLIRDHDSKFAPEFDQIMEEAGVKVVRVGPGAPNLNAHAERFVLTVKRECLDHFVIFGESHFRYILTEFLEHYHGERPHQGRDNVPLSGTIPDDDLGPVTRKAIVCRERLGGLLKHYQRKAA